MKSTAGSSNRKSERIDLIIEIRRVYRRFADLLQQYRNDSPPRLHAAFVRTSGDLARLNRALALATLADSHRR